LFELVLLREEKSGPIAGATISKEAKMEGVRKGDARQQPLRVGSEREVGKNE